MLVAQMPLVPAYAETLPPAPQVVGENSVIAQTFKAFPNGGEALSKRIADVIVANPKLAPDLVVYMRNTPSLSRAQKLAAEHALTAAMNRLGIKAAEVAVPPVVTKEGIVEPVSYDWLWLAALIAGVGGACLTTFCNTTSNACNSPTCQ